MPDRPVVDGTARGLWAYSAYLQQNFPYNSQVMIGIGVLCHTIGSTSQDFD